MMFNKYIVDLKYNYFILKSLKLKEKQIFIDYTINFNITKLILISHRKISIANNEHKLFFRESIEKCIYKSGIYEDNPLIIDDDFITKNCLEHKNFRCLVYDLSNTKDFKTVLVNIGNLSSPLLLPIVFSPPAPMNSNFVKARLGNGRRASSTVSFLLRYQFQTRAAQARHA